MDDDFIRLMGGFKTSETADGCLFYFHLALRSNLPYTPNNKRNLVIAIERFYYNFRAYLDVRQNSQTCVDSTSVMTYVWRQLYSLNQCRAKRNAERSKRNHLHYICPALNSHISNKLLLAALLCDRFT